MAFERPVVGELVAALERRPPLLQVLVGPRQAGNSTAAAQIAARLGWPHDVASADAPLPHPPEWIETQWRLARARGFAQAASAAGAGRNPESARLERGGEAALG